MCSIHSPVQLNSSPMNPSGEVVASFSVSIYNEQTCGTHWSLESLHTYIQSQGRCKCVVREKNANNQRSYVTQELYPHMVAERQNIRRRTLLQTLSLKFTGVGPRVQLSQLRNVTNSNSKNVYSCITLMCSWWKLCPEPIQRVLFHR